MADEPLKICPSCDKPSLKKQVTAAAFRLKGGGWYETDFKTGNKKQLADSDSNAKPKEAAPKADTSTAKTSTSSD